MKSGWLLRQFASASADVATLPPWLIREVPMDPSVYTATDAHMAVNPPKFPTLKESK